LGAANRAIGELEKKLTLLEQYREDYRQRLQDGMQTGLSIQNLRNFQLFLDKIDQAVNGQQQLVRDAEQRRLKEQICWQENERKRMSYKTVEQRAEKTLQQKEARRDQKQTDEHANRLLFYKN
jgi:flagellar FliJ protein